MSDTGINTGHDRAAAPSTPHRIEVRVREMNQLFNSMDPSPFFEKELDAEAEEYIVGWAKELPAGANISLVFHVDDLPDASIAQRLLSEAVGNFFAYKLRLAQRELQLLTYSGWTDLLRGLLCLGASIVIANLLDSLSAQPHIAILKESIIIGGWVAMWRPMEIFLYERWPRKRLCHLYRKLQQAPITVVQGK